MPYPEEASKTAIELKRKGIGVTEISRRIGRSRMWVYLVLNSANQNVGKVDPDRTLCGKSREKRSGGFVEIKDHLGGTMKPSILADKIQAMLDRGESKAEIARTFGIDRSTLYLRVIPATLIQEIRSAIDHGKFTINQARPLSGLSKTDQRRLWRLGISKMTRREIEEII